MRRYSAARFEAQHRRCLAAGPDHEANDALLVSEVREVDEYGTVALRELTLKHFVSLGTALDADHESFGSKH
jgi:hypothetical protein